VIDAIQRVIENLQGYHTLTFGQFDRITHREGVDSDDDVLIRALVDLGWTHSGVDDLYISPPDPKPQTALERVLGADLV
jgi:hypothetical protein